METYLAFLLCSIHRGIEKVDTKLRAVRLLIKWIKANSPEGEAKKS